MHTSIFNTNSNLMLSVYNFKCVHLHYTYNYKKYTTNSKIYIRHLSNECYMHVLYTMLLTLRFKNSCSLYFI